MTINYLLIKYSLLGMKTFYKRKETCYFYSLCGERSQQGFELFMQKPLPGHGSIRNELQLFCASIHSVCQPCTTFRLWQLRKQNDALLVSPEIAGGGESGCYCEFSMAAAT